MGAALALVILKLLGREWKAPRLREPERGHPTKTALAIGLLVIALGVLMIAMTYSVPAVANLFLGIGPKIPGGVPTSEEYNPGYLIGAVLILLTMAILAFENVRSE